MADRISAIRVWRAPLTLEWNLYLKGVRQEHGKAAMALRDGT